MYNKININNKIFSTNHKIYNISSFYFLELDSSVIFFLIFFFSIIIFFLYIILILLLISKSRLTILKISSLKHNLFTSVTILHPVIFIFTIKMIWKISVKFYNSNRCINLANRQEKHVKRIYNIFWGWGWGWAWAWGYLLPR